MRVESVRQKIDGQSYMLFVVRDARGIVGSCMLSGIADPHPTFHSLFVVPRKRRKGVARALVNAAVAFARRTGKRSVALTVETGNKAAIALYGSVGFKAFTAGQGKQVWMGLALPGNRETKGR